MTSQATSLPLAGRRILVTRAAHQAGKLSDGLRALGAEPVEVPVLEIQPPDSFAALDGALTNLAGYDWLILTSANTIRALATRAATLGIWFAQPAGLKVAAIGQATADVARKEGFQVTIVPESYVAESLVEALGPQGTGQKILLARAAVARDIIPDALRKAGAQVDIVDAYRNLIPADAPTRLSFALKLGIDAATFTSSSSATRLAEAAKAAQIPWPFTGVPAISIGPITSATLRELAWVPAIEAAPSDIPGLIAAVAKFFSTS